MLMPALALPAPGTLADSPLFLSTATEPNVFFLLDDSGSMEWEALVQNGVSGLPNIGGWTGNYYILPSRNNGLDSSYITAGCNPTCYPYVTPSESAVSGAWVARNSDFNALYYNPETTYEPWQGSDAGGSVLYNDSTPTAAPVDPTNPGGNTLNLTQSISFFNYAPSKGGWFVDTIYPAQYYTWTDSNSNGVVDASDAHALVQITSSTATYTHSNGREDCAAAPVCTYAEEIQNFANWYTYYRKRSYVAKKAIGNVVNATDKKRMGLQVYNGGLVMNASSMSTAANKLSLLQDIYGTSIPCNFTSCPGTPARSALNSVGNLFEGSSSPILSSSAGGACQQNFDVIISDGYWNGSPPTGIGNSDGDNNTAFDGGSYGDAFSVTLADVAMHYYERDLKSALADNVPIVTGLDEASHQHLVTFSVAFGVTGTIDPATNSPTDIGFTWPDPTDTQDDERIDDMWHAAYNGRGSFLSAQDPQELIDSLTSALASISDRTGAAAAVAFNSSTLSTNSAVYLALFNSSGWSGDLESYPLDSTNGYISSTRSWSAADQLDARNLTTSPRVILTNNGTDGVSLEWSNLTTAQQNDLRTNANGGQDSVAIGQARLDFIKGNRSDEGTNNNFRVRGSRLGDMVHAGPVYVGKPQVDWPDTSPFPTGTNAYSSFSSSTTRDGVIYVGANDGMLHGFNEDTGNEVLAYIPSDLFSTSPNSGLHYLTEQGYNHHYYVDLTPTISDAYIKNSPTGSTEWRTVLIGGERGGGRGLFALDVTDPNNFTTANAADLVLWEFDSSDDADLGYSFSKPVITLLNNGQWAAIFGNGYNDDPGGSGEAKLFIIFLEGGLDGTWSASDYIKITTGAGSASNRNGLSDPAVVDLDGNGTADRVYAGDLQGNMWAFDLSSSNDNQWDVAYKTGSTPKPLFTATTNQPITSAPSIVNHPTESDSGNTPNLMVLFGSGQYLADGDNLTTNTQSFYGVWDRGTKELSRSNLVAQTFESGFNADIRVPTNNSVDYASGGANKKYGWFIDLPTSGERVVSTPFVRGDIVYFNTMIPSSDPCSYGGDGWLMSVKYSNGGRPDTAVFDYDGNGSVNTTDLVTNGTLVDVAAGGVHYNDGLPTGSSFMGDVRYTPGTSTENGNQIQQDNIEELGGGNTGRLSWEEISR